MSKKVILKVENLKKGYSMQHLEETLVLKGITVEIYEKDFTVIMGSSGSGKSTFLYCVSGMDSISSGNIYLREDSIHSMKEKQLAMLRRGKMGFVFQQMNLLPALTLKENITAPAYLLHKEKTGEILNYADKLMNNFGIETLQDRKPNQVSGGQLQRAAIARAMINRPDIIFADEPTGALNSSSGKDVLDILTDCSKNGQSILMVTHDVNAALRANRILYLRDGMIAGDKELIPYQDEVDWEKRKADVLNWLSEMGW